MIGAVALHEFRRLRSGLLFWLLLAFGQLLIAWLAFAQLEAFAAIAPQLSAAGSALGPMDLVITPTLNSLLLLALLSVPLLAMGSLSGEAHSGRLALWLSAPVGTGVIVLGKLLGVWLAGLVLLLSTGATLASLGLGIAMDWPRLALGLGFLALLLLWLGAISLALSAWIDQPAAALAAAYGVLLFLWLLDSLVSAEASWTWVALLPHARPALGGLLRSQDLVYLAATGAAALLLAAYRLACQRGEN
jgi:ABC-2 type transport system permease protein